MEDYLGRNIPKLGFGMMRLPRIDKSIDIEQVMQMVDLFLDRGFTYFDTAYMYQDSEDTIRQALAERYPRDSYQLASKLPAWKASSKKEAQEMFWTSLKRCGVCYFDYYLLHNLGSSRSDIFDKYDLWQFIAKLKEEGLIRNIGFSIHDKASHLDEILTRHPEVDFVQLQINYLDWDSPIHESQKCYETARKHNKPIIVMEPVKGGNLMILPSAAVDAFASVNPYASLASWAIRYAASLEGIITVLSGMSTLAQVEDNTTFMADFKPLSQDEMTAINSARAAISQIPSVPCTYCGYCLPVCKQKVAIPGIFEALNLQLVFNNETESRWTYGWHTSGQNARLASACIECGDCELVCSQRLPIIKELKRARGLFESA